MSIVPTTDTTEDAEKARMDAPGVVAAVLEVAERPRLRGWLHAVMTPLVALGGAALVVTNPTHSGRLAMAVFALTATVLFGVSGLYHRFAWGERVRVCLKRLDHANIYLIIAGTYTAFAVTLLDPDQAKQLLAIVWPAAIGGVVFNAVWVTAPRLLITPLYILLGWVALFYIEPFYTAGGPLILALIVSGGVLYTMGGLVYGLKRPDPFPRWFGYHEVFHAFTVLAFASHFVAAVLATASVADSAATGTA